MPYTFELFSEEAGGASLQHGELAEAASREEAAEQACFAFRGRRSASTSQGYDGTLPKRVVAYDDGVEFWSTTETEQTSCVEIDVG